MTSGKILSVGLICADVVNYVVNYPIEDSDERIDRIIWTSGGNATNVSKVLKSLDIQCDLYGTLGCKDDPATITVEHELGNLGISLEKCERRITCQLPTSSVIVNQENGSRTILHYNENILEPTFEEFTTKFPDFSQYDVIYFEGRNLQQVKQMIDHVVNWRSSNKNENCHKPKIIVELEKPRHELDEIVTSGVNYVVLGKMFTTFRGFSDSSKACKELGDFFFTKNENLEALLCPWGDQGAAIWTPNEPVVNVPAYNPDRVIDTLGAGDSFIAGCIFALKNDLRCKEVAKMGCKVAGLKCGSIGYDLSRKIDHLL